MCRVISLFCRNVNYKDLKVIKGALDKLFFLHLLYLPTSNVILHIRQSTLNLKISSEYKEILLQKLQIWQNFCPVYFFTIIHCRPGKTGLIGVSVSVWYGTGYWVFSHGRFGPVIRVKCQNVRSWWYIKLRKSNFNFRNLHFKLYELMQLLPLDPDIFI